MSRRFQITYANEGSGELLNSVVITAESFTEALDVFDVRYSGPIDFPNFIEGVTEIEEAAGK